MLLFYAFVDFYFFYDGAVDIQIRALLTRSRCKVSDTQVTVKDCGPIGIDSQSRCRQLLSKNYFTECKERNKGTKLNNLSNK